MQQQLEAHNRRAPLATPEPTLQWLPMLPHESPCFDIRRIELLGDPHPGSPWGFGWLLADLGNYSNACLGAVSLDHLRRNLDGRLLARGYITSHVSVPAQNLSLGLLKVQLHLGRIAQIEHRRPPTGADQRPLATPPRNALALSAGAVLNLRDLEQTLENMARVPSQAVQFQIEAAEQPGSSVVVVSPTAHGAAASGSSHSRPWRLVLALDNAAARDYGQWQSHLQATVDAPLGLADPLYVSTSRTLRSAAGTQQQASSVFSYAIPWGAHALQINGTHSSHTRPIQGLSARFSEHGFERSVQARWQWVAWRSASSRLQLWGGHTQRRARNHVDDVELVLQRRRVNTWDWGLNSYTRWPAGELSLDYEQGISSRLAPETDFQLDEPPLARTRRLQLDWTQPVQLGAPAQYGLRLAWAGVRRPAGGADLQSLGSRWSVRGFDAQNFVSGQEQITVRQDLRWGSVAMPGGLQLQPYLGIDYGRVAAVSASPTPEAGRTLVGAAAGVRGQGAAGGGLASWGFDVAIATPLHRPQGFATAKAVIYSSFSVSY